MKSVPVWIPNLVAVLFMQPTPCSATQARQTLHCYSAGMSSGALLPCR